MPDTDDTTTPATGPDSGPDSGSASGPEAAAAPAAKKAAKKAPAKKAAAKKAPAKKAAAKKAAPDPVDAPTVEVSASDTPVEKPKKKAVRKSAKKVAESTAASDVAGTGPETSPESGPEAGPARAAAKAAAAPMVLFQAPEVVTNAPRKRASRTAGAAEPTADGEAAAAPAKKTARKSAAKKAQKSAEAPTEPSTQALLDAPAGAREQGGEQPGEQGAEQDTQPKRGQRKRPARKSAAEEKPDQSEPAEPEHSERSESEDSDTEDGDTFPDGSAKRRPRRRGGRRRRRAGGEDGADDSSDNGDDSTDDDQNSGDDSEGEGGGTRRRRRRRRSGDEGDGSGDDPAKTVTRVRKVRNPEDEITSVQGSTRLAAKKQRRQEGREAGRRRAPIVSEAEFLARRESVERVMVVRQKDDLTQIAVLEDKVLVEHYVARDSQTSLIGNVYLGRVQNVLPSMEAAFIDIGKGRNAVLYAGEVNWSALGHKDGAPRKIESVLKSGQTILVQVTKDPVGHKGARLTSQISLPGRFLVYVPDGNTSGISRKLPDTERNRLKSLLKEIVPDTAGVIVRTAAEGASEEELTHDVQRLTARWTEIERLVAIGKSPELLYGEPDLTLKVVRDLFTEDFAHLLIQGGDAWNLVDDYVSHVAPDLRDRLQKYDAAAEGQDLFTAYRVDEQIAKGLDRKVWLPSGGSLVIDRTEAMTVVDVNTGKFTGSGGNLEETVTKNNLEAAEEMVRQLRLRDIGGIIVIDFIDMVLEVNRDLVLRRLIECLGRDRTRHQVAEVTSLGLVQMTRKRIGSGLLESFSEDCDHCKGRGVIVHEAPIEASTRSVGAGGGMGDDASGNRRSRGGRNRSRGGNGSGETASEPVPPSPKVLAGTRPHTDEKLDVVIEAEATVMEPAAEPSPPQAPEAAAVQINETAFEREPVEPATPAEPAAPRVVTSTRRRGVRRAAGAAGAAVTLEAGESAAVVTTAQPRLTERTLGQPRTTPVDDSDEERADSISDETSEAEALQAVDVPEPETAEIDTAADEDNVGDDLSASSLLHVPIKRKGARKR